MGILSDIRLGLRHPKLVCRKLNQLSHSRLGRWEYNRNGIDVFEQDWDSLLILDACRSDMLGDELFGQPVESVESRGSGTIEFLRGNVGNRDLTDTVYVTANPQLYRNRHQVNPEFHDVINIWMDDGWDEEYGTVLPETVYENAVEAAQTYPKKRLLIHFLQPHLPFIDPHGNHNQNSAEISDIDEYNLWLRILMRKVESTEISEIIRDYNQNLKVVLPYVRELLNELDGKTVITSDHGNLLGERASPLPITDWGHPLSMYVPELVSVPWVVFEGDRRRRIISENPVQTNQEAADEDVVERLEQLGYK